MKAKGEKFANGAVAIRDTFVQMCMMGQRTDNQGGPPDMQQSYQVRGLCASLASIP